MWHRPLLHVSYLPIQVLKTSLTKGGFFSESEIRFSNLPVSQQNYSKKLERNDSNLTTVLCIYVFSVHIFQQSTFIKIELLCSSCLIKFWCFFFKPKKKFPDGTSLRPGWIVRVVEAIDVIEAAEVPNAREITQYVKCRLYLIFRGLRVIGQILTTQDSQTTFKPNLAAIFLSARDY